jgi:hypothetical protein
MECRVCTREIEIPRVELGFLICLSCAKNGYAEPRKKGYMAYDHKTAGTIQIVSPEMYDEYKRVSAREGQSSTLRNVLDGKGKEL